MTKNSHKLIDLYQCKLQDRPCMVHINSATEQSKQAHFLAIMQ